MNAQEFLDKFPDTLQVNENCLMDMACPNCGQRDRLKISFNGLADVNDDGSDDVGDHEWDDNHNCHCPECMHYGKVRDFTFEGLDEKVTQIREN